jgi:hypothetical protein
MPRVVTLSSVFLIKVSSALLILCSRLTSVPGRPAPDIVVPDYSASNDQAAEIKRALLAYHDNIVTPDGVHITFESADVTMLDNEVRADEVIQIAPPPYSENAERPLRLLSLGQCLRLTVMIAQSNCFSLQTAEESVECPSSAS